MAHIIASRLQRVIYRNPPIKNKALALPPAVFRWDILEILQDPAFKVIDFIKPQSLHKGAGFFTSDTTSAIHRYFLGPARRWLVSQRMGPLRKITEILGQRIYRTFKHADRRFIGVTGIDKQYIGVIQKSVPILWVNIGAGLFCRSYIPVAKRDNFAFWPGLSSAKGLAWAI